LHRCQQLKDSHSYDKNSDLPASSVSLRHLLLAAVQLGAVRRREALWPAVALCSTWFAKGSWSQVCIFWSATSSPYTHAASPTVISTLRRTNVVLRVYTACVGLCARNAPTRGALLRFGRDPPRILPESSTELRIRSCDLAPASQGGLGDQSRWRTLTSQSLTISPDRYRLPRARKCVLHVNDVETEGLRYTTRTLSCWLEFRADVFGSVTGKHPLAPNVRKLG
jgi:hypothetical protein